MNNQYLSYDIEILEDFAEGEQPDLKAITPSVAAICTTIDDTVFFDDIPHMSKETAKRLVQTMLNYQNRGYKIFTWNGLSFDFQLLAHYSEMIDECSKLALNHIDGMFLIVSHKGFFLGLDKALTGAGLETKLHTVTLNDNTTLREMNGSKAPLLWRNKEFSAVRSYLKYDVIQPLKLAQHIEQTGCIKWTSNAGKVNKCFTQMLTVKECLKLPLPDTSWMTSVKKREDFYNWIPDTILKEEGVL